MAKDWNDSDSIGEMDIFDPGKHFGGKHKVRRKQSRKLDDRGEDVVNDTGHYVGQDMPARPKRKVPTGVKVSNFERTPKTRF